MRYSGSSVVETLAIVTMALKEVFSAIISAEELNL